MIRSTANQNPNFDEFAPAWFESRKPFLSPRTVRDYHYYLNRLAKFFGQSYLREIDGEQLRAYQRARMATLERS